jgi:lysophospholipase L1-like esterase
MVLRVGYFQIHSQNKLAIISLYDSLKYSITKKIAERKVKSLSLPKGISEALYSDMGKDMLIELKINYEKYFKELVLQSGLIKSKLIVLYIPSIFNGDLFHIRDDNRKFFLSLCNKYDVDFLDVTETFMKYPAEIVTLLPENAHLSRYGNQILAEEISKYISKYDNYFSKHKLLNRPKLLGDLKPNDNSIWIIEQNMPYIVITNAQGLRSENNVTFPKNKQRILNLGDSLTFGPYLANHDTYPELLNKKYNNKEFFNGGVAGYTIAQESELFTERAKYIEPDITILEVLDNDITGLFSFGMNVYDRHRIIHKPSFNEIQLLERLRKAPKK